MYDNPDGAGKSNQPAAICLEQLWSDLIEGPGPLSVLRLLNESCL
jgi:hypothetical protein